MSTEYFDSYFFNTQASIAGSMSTLTDLSSLRQDQYLVNTSIDQFKKTQKINTPKDKIKKKRKSKELPKTPENQEKVSSENQNQNNSRKNGHWDSEENKRYHYFLEVYSGHFLNKHLRRMDKIFKSMARFIGSRQAQQCRSHHQKMEKKYARFSQIIQSLRLKLYGTSNIQSLSGAIRYPEFQDDCEFYPVEVLQKMQEQQLEQKENPFEKESASQFPIDQEFQEHKQGEIFEQCKQDPIEELLMEPMFELDGIFF